MPALIQVLQYSDDDLKRDVAEVIVQIGGVNAIPGLSYALQSGGLRLRREAAEALAKIGDATTIPILIMALHDNYPDVRRPAAQALAQIGGVDTLPGLIHAFQDFDPDVRRIAAEAIVKMGNKAVLALNQPLQANDARVRRYAAETLGRIKDISTIHVLIQALQDDDDRVRQSVAKALGQIGNAVQLPRMVISMAHIPVAERVAILKAMGQASSQEGALCKYKVLPLMDFCLELFQTDDIPEEIKIGAKAILDYMTHLRPGARNYGTEYEELLRGASASESSSSPAELMRASEAIGAKQSKKRRKLWERLLDR